MLIKLKRGKGALYMRATPASDRTRMFHCGLSVGAIQAYAIGDTRQDAEREARRLSSIRVHALSAADAKNHKALRVGLPAHYRLAQ